jgi:polyphenol oxidase
MNRRQFAKTLGQGSLGAFVGLKALRTFGQAGHELPVDCSPPNHGTATHITFNTSAPVLPRKSVWDLSGPEVTRLQKAYTALRNLSISNPNDPRGWMQQANVHCFYCSGGYDASNVEIHGGWWFLPWHRCYLHVHERILGKLINDPTFRLAYWDWDTYPGHAGVPPAFLPQTSLFDQWRGAVSGDVIPTGITDPASMQIVMGTQGTAAFMGGVSDPPNNIFPAGALENSPHGPVHLWTGEPNPGQSPEPPGCFWPNSAGGPPVDQSQTVGCLDMGVLATAAQDPVFFAHHANIDRLWDVWLGMAGSQGNYTVQNWLKHPFNFYDENGNWIYITVADVLDQKEQDNLRYQYQPPQSSVPLVLKSVPPQKNLPKAKQTKPLVVATSTKPTAVGTKPHVRTVALPLVHQKNLKLLATGGRRQYVLHIDGLTLPPNESAIVNVFVGDPNANRDTPVGPSFVGTFSIVVSGLHHTHATVRNAIFELRPETADLLLAQKKLTVTLVPKLVNGKEPPKSSLTYKKIFLTQQ